MMDKETKKKIIIKKINDRTQSISRDEMVKAFLSATNSESLLSSEVILDIYNELSISKEIRDTDATIA